MERSGLGDELNFVPTDPKTLRSRDHENIFVIGDATNCPSSKAGSVAHFQADVLFENIQRHMEGRPLLEEFDGHANCFIESGFGKGLLIDFNYDTEPLPGKYPLPGIGPFSLLEETEMNHWGKVMFRWTYWHVLLKGKPLPLPSDDDKDDVIGIPIRPRAPDRACPLASADPPRGRPPGDALPPGPAPARWARSRARGGAAGPGLDHRVRRTGGSRPWRRPGAAVRGSPCGAALSRSG